MPALGACAALLPRAQRVAGRGRGWGALSRDSLTLLPPVKPGVAAGGDARAASSAKRQPDWEFRPVSNICETSRRHCGNNERLFLLRIRTSNGNSFLNVMTPTPERPAIELANINLSLGSGPARVHILKDITLHIGQGEAVGLTGPSGSGKSTLLMIMAGLERPDAGDIRVAGTDLDRPR